MSRRIKRIEHLLQEKISEIILNDVSDPRLEFITITDVSVSPDIKHATVYYSVIGDQDALEDVAEAFEHATGFIQRHLTDIVYLQYTPKILFKYDDTLEKAQQMEELIDSVQHEDPEE